MDLTVWADGSITGGAWGKKTGPETTPHGWSGWVVKRPDGVVVAHHSIDLGEAVYMSANIAEYMAVRSALKWLRTNNLLCRVEVRSDSQLIVCQLQGAWQCYNPRLLVLRDDVRRLAATFQHVFYKWIPREENREADVLSKALQTWGYVPEWQKIEEAARE